MNKKSKEVKSITSCGAVVWRINDGKIEILLIRQSCNQDIWSIPKGRISKGESLEQCAMREVKEETNVDITLGQRLPDCKITYKKANKVIVSYLATPAGNQIPDHTNPKSEVFDAKWLSIENLPNINNYQKILLGNVIQILKSNNGKYVERFESTK